mmetsp:Transcript_108340/g.305484  ORF Transcript_108340/g.305484 Transcript_108340/m.305484 type:complete len:216 (+) Transcript_108340:336-983(+)
MPASPRRPWFPTAKTSLIRASAQRRQKDRHVGPRRWTGPLRSQGCGRGSGPRGAPPTLCSKRPKLAGRHGRRGRTADRAPRRSTCVVKRPVGLFGGMRWTLASWPKPWRRDSRWSSLPAWPLVLQTSKQWAPTLPTSLPPLLARSATVTRHWRLPAHSSQRSPLLLSGREDACGNRCSAARSIFGARCWRTSRRCPRCCLRTACGGAATQVATEM